MSTGNFIEDLLAQVTTKQAAEEGKENPFAKKDEKSEKGDKDDQKGKKKEKDDEGEEKEASLEALLNNLPDDLKKLASDEAQAMLLADLRRRELMSGDQMKVASFDEADLFNAAFEEHTMKLAALDPEYGAMLHEEQVKMAFNASFQETVEQVKQATLAQAYRQ